MMTTPTATTVTFLDVLQLMRSGRISFGRQHGAQHECPGCDRDPMREAVVRLVYSYEVCRCGSPAYEHLIEQAWHRACFATHERPTQ